VAWSTSVPCEPLSPQDATLLSVERSGAQLQIGALVILEGGPLRDEQGRLRIADLRRHIEARLEQVPRFQQRVVQVALGTSRPLWVDDVHFDIEDHVHRLALPPGGGHDELRQVVDRLLGRRLDSASALWEAAFVEGLEGDRVALVLRVHHVVADGNALLAAALLLLDAEPDPTVDRPGMRGQPTMPGVLGRLAASVQARARHQAELARRAVSILTAPLATAGAARTAVERALRAGLVTAPALPMTRPVGARRAFAWSSLPMAELVEAGHARGATLNDVVLAVVCGALRRQLDRRGVHPERGHLPRVLVPVGGLRPSPGEVGNSFSLLTADLPVDVDDPLGRLDRIHDQLEHAKATSRTAGLISTLFAVADVVPPVALGVLGPAILDHQPFVNLAVTNIPGTREPRYLLGARLESIHPIVTGVGNIATIVGVLSYCDRLGVGVTVDPDVAGDPGMLVDDLEEAAGELLARAR
jgi:diacylglycerol O-acyltransferase / wax synthase